MNRPELRQSLFVVGAILIILGLAMATKAVVDLPAKANWPRPQPITCVRNLKQVGIAFKLWSLDHGGNFPFNVSTNAGGTLEFCSPGPDGYDQNVVFHFQVLSNELGNPRLLICPQDNNAKPAASFSKLNAGNISYRLRTGTKITDAIPQQELASCPIHGNILHCDGSVTEARPEPDNSPGIFNVWRFNSVFRSQITISTSAMILGVVLLLMGLLRKPSP